MKKNKLVVFIALLLVVASPKVKAQGPNWIVDLDTYFNHEVHKNAAGEMERFHYIWEEKDLNGYSNWGNAFVKNGGTLKSLDAAPTAENLKGSNIYIIVDPDTKKESPNPNYIEAAHIKAIADWVKAGGILVMMANDSANVELLHFNKLAAVFGMHFNDDLQNHVIGENREPGTMMVPAGHPILKTAKKIYMKDVCSISVSKTATSAFKNTNGATVIATAKYGKGLVFAVSDPWLYNEYTNGHLPAGYDNDKATEDVAKWLIEQAKAR